MNTLSNVTHTEEHFTASETVRDIVIGMSDGLTVPFALAAGLSGAVDNPKLIITAGLAEIAAGAIAMGLGGYLAAKTESEHYASEWKREEAEIIEKTKIEEKETYDILTNYGLAPEQASLVVESLKKRPKQWIEFMMRFELGLEEPDPRRAAASARNIALSYLFGGLIPLLPYYFFKSVVHGFILSTVVTAVALLIFGYIKGRFTGFKPVRSAGQTVLIGGLAAFAAYVIARLIS
jgi:VIT1/CCC1 family predicted Fe2+/Mn2+ transporter